MDVKTDIFTAEDKKLMQEKQLSTELIEQQLKYFREGFAFAEIVAAATPKYGINTLSEAEKNHYISIFEHHAKDEDVLKFVPASGAASRMFKALSAFMNSDEENPSDSSVQEFFERIEEFAFFPKLRALCEKHKLDIKSDTKKVLELFLTSKGLNYGNLPKALLLFHKYENGNRTAAEEHFTEALSYASRDGRAVIHFTVSPEHRSLFTEHIQTLKNKYADSHGIHFNIEISEQKPYTDTIAVDMQNKPFRTEEGKLLFRPGGHGALIENLNELNADIVFVKNIDNVVPDRLKDDTYDYKKALAGLLIETRDRVYFYLKALEAGNASLTLEEAEQFIRKHFSFQFPDDYAQWDKPKQKAFLFSILNRPLRVCGMVKNEGEPGGGPFFVKKADGQVSLQIVEAAQIDRSDEEKNNLVQEATHFNPVDLVLSVKDYQGIPFDLRKFVDPETGFISKKSQNGKSLKALELPGLWNGAMANWNTVFVEVPISTFNPVKTVNDLLRPEHLQ